MATQGIAERNEATQMVGVDSGEESGRLPEAEARRIVEAWLDEHAPGYPTYTLAEDGKDGWAFWIVPEDTTSYLAPEGRIQWMGTGWPETYGYDGMTGEWRVVELATGEGQGDGTVGAAAGYGG